MQSLAIYSRWNSSSSNVDYMNSRDLIKPKLIYDSMTFSRKECPGINACWRRQNKVHRKGNEISYENVMERERNLQRKHRNIQKFGLEKTLNLVPIPLSWSGTPFTTPSFSKPHPTWRWTFPGIGHPKLLRATCSRISLSNFNELKTIYSQCPI